MSYKATLDDFERRLAKLRESCAPNPFIPEGYCPLATAVDRAAAAYFPDEYARTNVTSVEQERLAHHGRSVADLKRLDTWERDLEAKRRKADKARAASAGNVNSATRRASVHWAETSLPARPLSEDQERAARRDIVPDDEVISIRQRMERRASLIDAAWKRLRLDLHDGKLAGYVLGNHGGHPREMEAAGWSARRVENAHKQDALMNVLVKDEELAALLSGDQSLSRTDAGSVAEAPPVADPMMTTSTAIPAVSKSRRSDQGPYANSSEETGDGARPRRNRVKSDNVIRAVKNMWGEDGPPASLLVGQRNKEINGWLKANKCAAVSDKQITRVLKSLPQT
ncbi:hypothetical protein ACD578_24490 [Microvirga sp. RSM25]|uniref:hypothetical protein n=1 Tax=Microvirga sp. RSM25 TaxID=3273802 RepID=UPI00384A800A